MFSDQLQWSYSFCSTLFHYPLLLLAAAVIEARVLRLYVFHCSTDQIEFYRRGNYETVVSDREEKTVLLISYRCPKAPHTPSPGTSARDVTMPR